LEFNVSKALTPAELKYGKACLNGHSYAALDGFLTVNNFTNFEWIHMCREKKLGLKIVEYKQPFLKITN
jgi:hypothetical protein